MKTKVLMLAVFMGLTTVLVAQPDEKGEGKPRHGSNPEMRMDEQRGHENGLDLTDAQKEAFKKSMLAMQKQLQPIRNQLGEARAHQKTLTTSDNPDMDAINKNIEKMGSLKTEMAKIQAKHHLEMRTQLTDEQRLKFDMFEHRKGDGRGPEGMKHRGDYSMR
jgi:Spy/CpxP family protein refolding chaperone